MPNVVFRDERIRTCDDWCAPLHLVERAVAGQRFARFFSVDDFMIM